MVTVLLLLMGLVEGGIIVIVVGYFFSDLYDFVCKFGLIGFVVGEWIVVDEYRCLAFVYVEGWVNFDIGMVSEFGVMFVDGL